MQWTVPAPLVSNGDPVSANSVNKSTLVLSERTAILKSLIDAITAGENIVMKGIPVADDVLTGHVVYYDDDTALHSKALARWETPGQSFTAVPSDSSIYAGLVIDKPTTQTANILLAGAATLDSAAQDRLFNSVSPAAGVYYLSPTTEGTVQSPKPAIGVRVLEYLNAGVVRVYPPSSEPITHTHLTYDLVQADWLPVGSFTDPPAGATFGYDFTTANSVAINLAEALLVGSGEGSFIGKTDGIHYFSDNIFIDDTGIWWIPGVAPTQDIEFNILGADFKDISLIHTIISENPKILDVSNSNGRVVLQPKAYTTESIAGSGQAIVSIDFAKHILQLASVVHSIVAGAGISVSDNGSGTYTVGSALFNNLPILANTVNLNNAVTSVEGPHVVTQFPTDRLSVVACSCAIPDLSDGTYIARIWVQAISPVASQPAPSISYSLVPTPDAAGVTPAAAVADTLPAFPGSVTAGDIYYVETGDISLVGASRGLLNYTLTLDNPANALNIVATGIKLVQQ